MFSFNQQLLLLYMITLLITMITFITFITAKQIACDFNKLCYCYNNQQLVSEVTCIGVTLSKIPNMKATNYYRIRIRGSRDISVISNKDFANITVSSLTLSGSKLSIIEPLAFKHSSQTLTSLELSHSNIREFPTLALSALPHLQWLNMRANKIEELKSKDLKDMISLRSLLLSDNSLSVVDDQTFRDVTNLEYLDLDGNLITNIETTPFPSGLTTLSLANCLLQHIPIDSLANLNKLQILQLRGNLIRHLPQMKLASKSLEMLDLSHNLISSLSSNAFITSDISNPDNPLSESRNSRSPHRGDNANISYSLLRIRDLHLDFNFIQSLPSGIFRHISVQRLSLSNNRIKSSFMASDAFDGPINLELNALDLNYNLLDKYPDSLKNLFGLRQLLLKNNQLKYIDQNAFINCYYLEVLDLSKNLFTQIPSEALKATKNLIRINLQDNLITKLDDNELGEWSQSLISLSLAKNAIKSMASNAFKYANNLRELRLGGNNILHASSDILQPLRSLELLDLSNALTNYVSAGQVLQSVSNGFYSLKWLQLDYNRLKYSPSEALKALPALMHCDLENNQISSISSEFEGKRSLNTIILSRNQITVIDSFTFSDLPDLENIALYLNQIKVIKKFAFRNLAKLKTIILSKNHISSIESLAFHNLSQASSTLNILLDENKLKCFSMEIFSDMIESVATPRVLYLNVSHNEIEQINDCYHQILPSNTTSNQTKQTLNLRVLDLSFNSISSFANQFSYTICKSLHSLHINHNMLTVLPTIIIKYCSVLQILTLDFNLIDQTDIESYENQTWSSDLQFLSVRNNKISSLFHFKAVINAMKNLRVLDLSNNMISSLPANIFANTVIEKLILTNNKIKNIDSKLDNELSDNCFGVKNTLMYLELSHNYLTSVPIEVMSCENLIELSLTNNLIVELAEHSFTQFIRLLQLDLSDNQIKKVDNKAFVKCLPNLNTLKLNNISLTTVPILNLHNLAHIELSNNFISVIPQQSFARSRRIRHLDLSRNMLEDVPRYIWKYMTKLQLLNLAYNPIDVLDTSSFGELQMLRHLDIRGLSLQYIDTRFLHNHRYLISLKTSTYPNMRTFRLHDILVKTTSLRSALIDVQEPTLSHQIQWAFGTKLKELIITGSNLVNILPDAFLGLHNTYDLTLRVTHTNITNLPNGFLRYLADIRYMTIDLRKNKLESLTPDVFLVRSDSEKSKKWESQQLLGGILLDDNPLKCDCSLYWISEWMRRWISDMRIVNIEAAIQANLMVRQSQCIKQIPIINGNFNQSETQESERKISLLDLTFSDISCENLSNHLKINVILIVIINLNWLCIF